MKLEQLRQMDDDALVKQLSANREELLNLRFQHSTGALENSARIDEVKRTVARILTVQNERGRTAAAQPVPAGAKQNR